jgi:glycosidase
MLSTRISYTPDRRALLAVIVLLAACVADPQLPVPNTGLPNVPDVLAFDALDLGVNPHDTEATPLPVGTAEDGGETVGPSDSLAPDSSTDGSTLVPLAVRECEAKFRHEPTGEAPESVHVAGAFNDWDPAALPLSEQEDGAWLGTLDLRELAQGSYGYKLVLDGEDWRLDLGTMMRRFDGEFENSKLLVPNCHAPSLEVIETSVEQDSMSVRIEVAVQTGIDGELDLQSLSARHGLESIQGAWDATRGTLVVDLEGLAFGKHTFRFDAAGSGGPAEPLLVSFWFEPEPFDWRDATLYFAFTDRFRDGDGVNTPLSCMPEDSIANWRGGDWAGITAAIEEGYFDDLGVRALWLSAPMDNPEDCVSGTSGKTYSAYHAYFPSNTLETEPRFGSLDDLRTLVKSAHDRGIRVLVDLVANHVYETATEYTEHADDGWFNMDGVCKEQGWEPAETCWFETYMPDLNHRNDAVVEHMTDVALYWLREADLDGFRIDAAKHMHPNFFHTLRHKVDEHITAHADQPLWFVGETFSGGWGGGTGSEEALVASYLGPSLLDGQFDFPLYWPLRDSLATQSAPLSWLGEAIVGTHAYYGEDAVMSSFLGNHDLPRFISIAAGQSIDTCPDGAAAAWACPPELVTEEEPYGRLLRAFTMLAAGPEVPLLYYGDEIGLAGAGDPDNRRMMPWGPLSDLQETLRTQVRALFSARAKSVALRRGDVSVADSSDVHLVLRRATDADIAYGAVNVGEQPIPLSLDVPGGGSLTDALTGESFDAVVETVTVTLEGKSARLLVP